MSASLEPFQAYFDTWMARSCKKPAQGREMERLMKPQREREQFPGQRDEHFTDTALKRYTAAPRVHSSVIWTEHMCACLVWALLQSVAVTQHIRLQGDQLIALLMWITVFCLIIYCSSLRLFVLIACGPPPTPHDFLLMHLPVSMATSNSIMIKQLEHHFQVVLGKGALCVAHDFITVFSLYVAWSRIASSQLAFYSSMLWIDLYLICLSKCYCDYGWAWQQVIENISDNQL